MLQYNFTTRTRRLTSELRRCFDKCEIGLCSECSATPSRRREGKWMEVSEHGNSRVGTDDPCEAQSKREDLGIRLEAQDLNCAMWCR